MRFRREAALPIATGLLDRLEPFCERITIAGSLRRVTRDVKDIEIVAMPVLTRDLFNMPLAGEPTNLDAYLSQLEADGVLDRRRGKLTKRPVAWGSKFKAFTYMGIPVDLFLVTPPAQWGVILAIRTGPAEYSQRLVTIARERGMRVQDGRIIHADGRAPFPQTPDEGDFFEALGIPYVKPEGR